MNYEQKYQKTLERAKTLYENANCMILKKWVERVFPELKESDDERIKESLLEYLHTLPNHYTHSGVCAPEWIAWLEKQGEQKPTDKVEPKFHEGEWVVDKQGIVHQIANVVENVTNHTYGYDIVGGGYFNDNNESVRLWTIQDAKDGDVLMANAPFIFNGNLEGGRGCPGAHCGINTLGKFQIPEDKKHWTGHITTPATKEQRDALMKAMSDAGYTFDFEKKELKKIAQKPVFEMKTPEESLGIDSDTYNKIVDECIYGEQKPTWSEEDECYTSECIGAIATKDGWSFEEKRKMKHWLESLKERVQPKQEWSEDDENFFNDTIAFFEDTKNALDHADWIKSLKQRIVG